jgi:hypothetical protein
MTTEIDIDLDKDFVDTVVEEIIPEECEAAECDESTDNRLVYFISGDGSIQVHRRNSGEKLVLTPVEAREFHLWLIGAAAIWKI